MEIGSFIQHIALPVVLLLAFRVFPDFVVGGWKVLVINHIIIVSIIKDSILHIFIAFNIFIINILVNIHPLCCPGTCWIIYTSKPARPLSPRITFCLRLCAINILPTRIIITIKTIIPSINVFNIAKIVYCIVKIRNCGVGITIPVINVFLSIGRTKITRSRCTIQRKSRQGRKPCSITKSQSTIRS